MKQLSKISLSFRKRYLKVSVLLILLVSIAFIVKAQHHSNIQKKHIESYNRHQMLPDLTDGQKDKMKAIHIKTLKEIQPLTNSLMEKKARLNTLSSVEKVDMKAINKQIDEISSIKASIQKIRAASKQEVRTLLTVDQRVIFDTKRGKMMHMKGRHGMQDGHGGGRHYKMRKSDKKIKDDSDNK